MANHGKANEVKSVPIGVTAPKIKRAQNGSTTAAEWAESTLSTIDNATSSVLSSDSKLTRTASPNSFLTARESQSPRASQDTEARGETRSESPLTPAQRNRFVIIPRPKSRNHNAKREEKIEAGEAEEEVPEMGLSDDEDPAEEFEKLYEGDVSYGKSELNGTRRKWYKGWRR